MTNCIHSKTYCWPVLLDWSSTPKQTLAVPKDILRQSQITPPMLLTNFTHWQKQSGPNSSSFAKHFWPLVEGALYKPYRLLKAMFEQSHLFKRQPWLISTTPQDTFTTIPPTPKDTLVEPHLLSGTHLTNSTYSYRYYDCPIIYDFTQFILLSKI